MNTELQSRCWACLPKEARENIRISYKNICENNECDLKALFEEIYGHHNLTSDTEPEEMLMVERTSIINRYKGILAQQDPKNFGYSAYNQGQKDLLDKLFGDKCLPDKESSVQGEPKFKVGDKVRLNFEQYKDGEYDTIGMIVKSDYGIYLYHLKNDGESYAERYLEPYIEPKFHKGDIVRNKLDGKIYKIYSGEGFYTLIKEDATVKDSIVPEQYLEPYIESETKDNVKVIEGWLAMDESHVIHIHENKPHLREFDKDTCKWYDYNYWYSDGEYYTVTEDLFPDITFENSPKKVRITIEEID